MSQKVTVKVVSQKLVLEYHGVGTKSSLVAASKMRALIHINEPKEEPAPKQTGSSDTSRSFLIYSGSPTPRSDGSEGKVPNPLSFQFEPALAKLKSYEEQQAIRLRSDFFSSVEDGKRSLVEKFGKRIPNEEIMKLASSLKSKSCTIWKHQVITTLSSDEDFPGAHRTREGKYTASVKSKTIYTMVPLSESQLNELKDELMAEKQSDAKRIATRTVRVGHTTWDSTKSGKVIFRELTKESSDLETS